MVKSKELSRNEQAIFYGQIRYPLLNDRELADRLDFKMTTLTAIKNRLKKSGYLSKIRVPMFHKFGCELFQVSFGQAYAPDSTSDVSKVLAQCERPNPRCFHSMQNSHQHMFMQVFRNYTEAKRINDRFTKAYLQDKFHGENSFKQVLFPFQLINVLNIFDYAPILKKTFSIEEPKMANKGNKGNQRVNLVPQAVRLKKLEKKILYGLVKYPSIADSRVCKKIGTTRQAVARMRKKFEKDGIIRTIKVANLQKIGYNLFVLFHIRLDPSRNAREIKDGINKIIDIMPPVFMVSEDIQIIHLSAFRNFEHCLEVTNELYSFFVRNELFETSPASIPFSIHSVNMGMNHDYSRAIKNILGV